MKKILTLCLALVMMMSLCLPVLARDPYISPEGGTITTKPGGSGADGDMNESPNSPQTGTPVWVLVVAGAAVASISGAAIAAMKLSSAK